MLYLAENLRKYRFQKNLTQEDVANYLGITSQSVSKWERGENYPDITFLPALANILEISIDVLIGMNSIRSVEARLSIHEKASEFQKAGDFSSAEQVYREALNTYPNKPGMMLGLAGVLALQGKSREAIKWIEKGLPISENEKQKATMRALLCFLYLDCDMNDESMMLASSLPHTRESREVIRSLIERGLSKEEINQNIKTIIIGDVC